MIINIENVGRYGIIKDIRPRALPPEAWSDGRNVVFRDGYAEKARGQSTVVDPVPFAPYNLFSVASLGEDLFWVACGLTSVQASSGESWTDISKVGGYSAIEAIKWTGGTLATLLVLNNGVDKPQYWDLDIGTPLADLPNWPPPGVTTMTARCVRVFRNQIIALDVNKDGTRYPTLVKWSSVADPGALPGSWDETDNTVLTGEHTLADTAGAVVDLVPAGLRAVVYKEDAIVAMTLTGRTFLYEFEYLSRQFGVFAPKCATTLARAGTQVAFGYDDIVRVEGNSIQSILHGKERKWLYNAIEDGQVRKCYTALNPKENEVWFCFPEQGNAWCNLALVYNWREDTFGVKELLDVSDSEPGIFDSSFDPVIIDDMVTQVIDQWLEVIDVQNFDFTRRRVLSCSPINQKIYQEDTVEVADTETMDCYIERQALAVNLTRRGELINDFENRKLIKRVYPHFEGTGTVEIWVGGQETPFGTVNWAEVRQFRIGIDKFANFWVSTVLPAFKFRSVGDQTWRLTGFSFEQEIVGKHW